MKKIAAVALTLALSLCMFGCGQKTASETNDESVTQDVVQEAVDKTKLESAINRATAIDPSSYTEASYGTLSSALSNAQTILDNGDATASEVNDATSALTSAIDGLSESFLGTLAAISPFEAATLSGSGDDVIDIPCIGYPCIIELTHDGNSNFAVKSIDKNGNNVDLLVNEIGAYNGTVTTYFDYSDSAMLEITADGSWTATFKPLASITKAENGSTFAGDGVVYIDENQLTKLSFSHDGESNFAVKAVGMNDSGLLVNEIGAYSGTVVWNQPQSFFIVSADGNWTISW